MLPTLNKLIIQMVLHLFGNTFDRAPWKVVGYFITATFLLCMFLSAIYALQKIYFNTGKDSTITGYLGHLYYCSEASLILSDTPSRSVICQEWCLHSENCGESVQAGGIWPELAPGLGLEPSLQAVPVRQSSAFLLLTMSPGSALNGCKERNKEGNFYSSMKISI